MDGIGDVVIQEILISGPRNAHALEQQALALMDRQIGRVLISSTPAIWRPRKIWLCCGGKLDVDDT